MNLCNFNTSIGVGVPDGAIPGSNSMATTTWAHALGMKSVLGGVSLMAISWLGMG